MTELTNPITGPAAIEAQGRPEDKNFGFDLCAGPYALIETSVTEAGSGYQLCGRFHYAPDTEKTYFLGFYYQKEGHKGGELYHDQDHELKLLLFGHGRRKVLAGDSGGREVLTGTSERSYTIGLGNAEGVTNVELGSDIAAYALTWRTAGRFGVKLRPYLSTSSGLPLDEGGEEIVSVSKLQLGVDFQLSMLDAVTRPPSARLSELDIFAAIAAQAHRFAKTYATAKTLAGPAAQTNELNEAYGFGGEGNASARLEDVGFINMVNDWGASRADSELLVLQGEGTSEQRNILIATQAVMSAGYFALSLQDPSAAMMTQGFAGGLNVMAGAMAPGMSARDLLLLRTVLNAAAFAAGWGLQEERAGLGLLQGAGQASIATVGQPDPAGSGLADERVSYHLVYEAVVDGGRYLGGQQTTHLPSHHLYTRMRLMGQTLPAPEGATERIDDLTGRDPLREGARAKMSASIGGEFEKEGVVLSAGVHTLLGYGDGPRPVPGVGVEEQLLLTLGNDDFRVEFGAGASQDYVNGRMELGISGIAGLRASF